jgi:hypothetical protein
VLFRLFFAGESDARACSPSRAWCRSTPHPALSASAKRREGRTLSGIYVV